MGYQSDTDRDVRSDPFDRAPDRAVVALAEFMADTGIQPTPRPTEEVRPCTNLADLDERELMGRYRTLVQWKQHLAWQVTHVTNQVKVAERDAARAFVDAKENSSESSDSAKEREAKANRSVRAAEDAADAVRARLRMWQTRLSNISEEIEEVNRAITLYLDGIRSVAREARHTA